GPCVADIAKIVSRIPEQRIGFDGGAKDFGPLTLGMAREVHCAAHRAKTEKWMILFAPGVGKDPRAEKKNSGGNDGDDRAGEKEIVELRGVVEAAEHLEERVERAEQINPMGHRTAGENFGKAI